MNKGKALLKKAGLFEKLAIYGDRRSFLKAIAQVPQLDVSETAAYLNYLQRLSGSPETPIDSKNVDSVLAQLKNNDAKDPSKKTLFDTNLQLAERALDKARSSMGANLSAHISPEDNVIDLDKESYAPWEHMNPGDTGDSGMSASEYDKAKREYAAKMPMSVPRDIQEKLGLSGSQLTGIMDSETKRRLDAFKLYHKLPSSLLLNQLFSKIRTESNEEVYDEGFGQFHDLKMKQDTKFDPLTSSRKMRQILKKYAQGAGGAGPGAFSGQGGASGGSSEQSSQDNEQSSQDNGQLTPEQETAADAASVAYPPETNPTQQKQVTKPQNKYEFIPADIQKMIGVKPDNSLGPNTQRELDRYKYQHSINNSIKGNQLYQIMRNPGGIERTNPYQSQQQTEMETKERVNELGGATQTAPISRKQQYQNSWKEYLNKPEYKKYKDQDPAGAKKMEQDYLNTLRSIED